MPFTINATNRTKNPQQFQALNNAEVLTLYVQNAGNGLMDKTTVGFNTDATNQFDNQLDAVKLSGALSRHTLYSYNADPLQWYSKNMNTSIMQTATVNVGFEPGVAGNYSMSFDGLQSFDPTSYITLEDKKLNVFHNVRNGAYNFTSNANDNWNRFVLHFTPKAETNSVNSTCTANGQITIEQPGTANWNYAITNQNSVVIASGTLNQSNPVSVSVVPDIYTITLTDNNGYTVVKNIQVNGAVAIVAGLNSSSAIAEVGEDITFESTTADAVTLEWNFGDGTPIQSGAQLVHNYSNEGTYVVTLTAVNADGCSSTAQQTITVTAKTTTGLVEADNSSIKVWSNGNRVFVDFSKLKHVEATVSMFNLLGQQLHSEFFGKNTVYSYAFSSIDAGYVMVSVKTEEGVVTRKVLITTK